MDTEQDEIYAFFNDVQSNEEYNIDNLETEFVLEKNLENDILPDEQSNNMLIPKANIFLAKNAESEVNNMKYNVNLQQEIVTKGKGKRNLKSKEKKDMVLKCRKRPTPNQKEPNDLTAVITFISFPEHHAQCIFSRY